MGNAHVVIQRRCFFCQIKFGIWKGMDSIAKKYYKYNRILFSLTGEWPVLDRKDQLIRKCILRFGIIILLVAQVLRLFTTTIDLRKAIDTFTFFVPTLIIDLSYYFSYIFHSKTVVELFERITEDWCELEDKEERDVIKKYTDEGRFYIECCIVLFSIFVVILLFCLILPISLDIVMPLNETRPRRLLTPVEFFIDEEKHFCKILVILYVLIIIQLIIALSSISGLLAALQHACAMFGVAGYMLEHVLNYRPEASCVSAKRDNILRSRIIRCVKYHRRTIEFVDLLNTITQETLFMCMTLAIVMLGVAFLRILQMNVSEDRIDQMMISIIYIPLTLSWIYFDCYVGQKVLDHSTQILEKTCLVPWYLESVKIQKLSFLIMIRSMKPCHITIGRFFACTHEFFAQLLRVSLSYATMVYSLQ